jgi:hypothetical protein
MKDLICDNCGGAYFYVVRAEQFQAGGYGESEFRSLTNAPKTVVVCLCGRPVAPRPANYVAGAAAKTAEEVFRKSIEAARSKQQILNPQLE